MKIPDNNGSVGKTSVTYHFDGGADMTALFSLNASYTRADGRMATEYVSSLPWSKTVDAKLPFDASLKMTFKARAEIPEKALYNVGFDGYLTYVKADGETSAPVRMPAAQGVADNHVLHLRIAPPRKNVSLRVAPLKFDKHFAFSFTANDSYVSAYSRIWSLINAKWVDDKEFYHLGRPRSTGYTPEYPLVMTDGCGGDRRFGFSCAIWPTLGDANNETRIKDAAKTADHSMYISWEELGLLSDFGVSMLYHNVDERIWDKTDPRQIAQGFVVDNQKTYKKIGVRMKILGLPDGNKAYVEAAQLSDCVVFTRNSLKSGERIDLKNCGSLFKKETYGGLGTSDIPTKLKELADQSAAQNPYWVGLVVHRPNEDCMQLFRTVYELYGKPGKDNIWVASWDEVYEYVTLREGTQITSEVNADTVDFYITLPDYADFQFGELSLLLDGAPGAAVEAVSDNIVGLTSTPRGDARLINVRFGPRWMQLAEKYTAEYEAVPSQEALDDARYFTGQLSADFAEPFERRLSAVIQPEKGEVTFEGAKRYQQQYKGYVYELSRTIPFKK